MDLGNSSGFWVFRSTASVDLFHVGVFLVGVTKGFGQ